MQDSTASLKVQTSGIDHIHLNVNHIDQAIELFTGLFDCRHNIPLHIDSIDGINSMNTLRVDVIAPASKGGFFARNMAKMGGEGLSAVSFYVDDIDEATRRIEATGIKAISKIGYPGIERQTQFHAKDCFGMSIELVYLYPDAEKKIAAIKDGQAKDNDGALDIPCQPGAVEAFGIDHVRLRVNNLEQAVAHFSRLFECEWNVNSDGSAARSSLGMHLLLSDNGDEGVDAFGIRVGDVGAAKIRAQQLGMRIIEPPAYLASMNCACIAPSDCFGVSLVLVQG
jgi:predicted enzyme related to lactoylglutathione lyase